MTSLADLAGVVTFGVVSSSDLARDVTAGVTSFVDIAEVAPSAGYYGDVTTGVMSMEQCVEHDYHDDHDD